MKNYDILDKKSFMLFFSSLICMSIIIFSGCFGILSSEKKVIVINVLDKDQYDDCHISGSINIPFETFEEKIKTFDKKNSYVLYCSNFACSAAPYAAQLLKDAGFEKVSVYHGGMVQWYQLGYPYQGKAQMEYLKNENEQFDDENYQNLDIINAEQLKSMIK